MAEKKYDIAEKYMQEAYNLNKSLNNRLLTPMIYKEFAKLYQLSGKYEKSADYWEKYNLLKDSIFSQDAAEQTAKMQTLYDTEKKEKENELLRKEQVIANTQIQRQFFMGLAGAGALLSVIAFALILLRNNREKQKINKLLTKQADDLQEANQQITVQNEELHQQQEEIVAQRDYLEVANQEINEQKTQIDAAYQNIKTLSEIGRKITSILDINTIISTVYENVNQLMAAEGFGIGLYYAKTNEIIFEGFVEKGEILPTHWHKLDEKVLATLCFNEQKEIVINNLAVEYQNYFEEPLVIIEGEIPKSVIYLPLTLENKPVGVITVQSFEENAYSEFHITMLQSLASYIAIALDNAGAYQVIDAKNSQITGSIRYAQTIQQAILPSKEQLAMYFPENFVLYQPKDVVSGDFYWLSVIQNKETQAVEKIFFGVMDCTGHGVPGAFMSLIGNT
jgi:GAF domain-containing protein